MKSIYVDITRNTNQMCGVVILKNFRYTKGEYYSKVPLTPEIFKDFSLNKGCDYLEVGFLTDKISTEVFDFLTEHFPIVFLSEKRLNKNTNHQFYFAIFDIKGKY